MENESGETDFDNEHNISGELEGAVGYASPLHAPIPLPPHLINHQQPLFDQIIDSENNNVDENSNDHQYDEYANYHRQFQHEYMRNQNQCQEQPNTEPDVISPLREALQSSISNSTPRTPIITHRRNLSEDLSLRRNCQRYSETDSANSLLPRLPPRTPCEDPSAVEVRHEAEELLCNFTAEEFRQQRLEPPDLIGNLGYSNPEWIRTGRELRMLADAFAKSKERNRVRNKAQGVHLDSINMENFFSLLSELFQGVSGVSRERIVVLFTFISDVAIAHVRRESGRFIRILMDWSVQYLWQCVCDWVTENGGWYAVLSQGANTVLKCSLALLALTASIALGMFIKRSL